MHNIDLFNQYRNLKPKRTFLIFILLTIFYNTSSAQKDPQLRDALSIITKASISGDVEGILSQTSFRLIKCMGGIEQATKLTKEVYSSLTNYGIKFDSVINYVDMEISKIDGIAYCFIPQVLVMSMPEKDKIAITSANLLALKEGEPERWTFLNFNKMDQEKINLFLPEFNGKITLPKGLEKKTLVVGKEEVGKTVEQMMKLIDESVKKRD
ncbi:hypothetical protein SF1_43580 [Sphingobacterium faecium NBRC 15299]|uniref:hypothetical protein n=1 Tax=Sphingobacterium faecium TaxID=34087 RepID=UPI000D395D6C|nr:hypothetical protein [Sphingobacterium faecium]PTX07595.1 hypothetical protein C8N37_111104 [Sphingobacterium faecium]GEM66376.1 hypothetical protein SF1_43580 [Sphingobacterium faecium NBRC 15299]